MPSLCMGVTPLSSLPSPYQSFCNMRIREMFFRPNTVQLVLKGLSHQMDWAIVDMHE